MKTARREGAAALAATVKAHSAARFLHSVLAPRTSERGTSLSRNRASRQNSSFSVWQSFCQRWSQECRSQSARHVLTRRTKERERQREGTMDDAVRWEPMLLQEPDLLVTGHVDVALQLLSVGDDADEEFPMGGAHDLTDNDSEAPSRGLKRASPVSSDASVGTAAAAAADTAATRECESKKRKALRKSTYHVRKVQRLCEELN